ncbi:MAG: AarF/ABC1/UbiB kinase family protein [Nocardia sp.]|nr:AarF/ABC1/UbiB kinase family protein [Nocardia sp.]
MTAQATDSDPDSGPGAGDTTRPPEPVPPLEEFGFAEWRRAAKIGTVITGRVARRVLREGLRKPARRRAMAEGTVDGFEALGPTFVKIGQLVASARTSFPAELADACLRCLDDVPAFPVAAARTVIEEDLGAPIDTLFREFDDEPLSAASVAQVHGCVLADGRAAVVKVQRPDITGRMMVDLRAAFRLASAAAKRSERARVASAEDLVRDLYDSTVAELDFRNEARAQAQMRANLSAFGDNRNVVIPEVYQQYCGPRVLCMERMYGVPLDRFDDIRAEHPDSELLIRQLVKAWMEGVIVHGLFHGDVHAGNLWMLEDGRAAMLDFGIVGRMTPQWRGFAAALFHASAVGGDFRSVAEQMRELGIMGSGDEKSDAAVGRQLATALAPVLSGQLAQLEMGKVATSLLEFGRRRDAAVPRQMVLMVKQLGYFERYAAALAPGWRLGKDLYLFRNIFPEEVAARVAAEGIELPAD